MKTKTDAVTVEFSDSQINEVAEFVRMDSKNRPFDTWALLVVERGIKSIQHTFDHAAKAKDPVELARKLGKIDPAALHAMLAEIAAKIAKE